MEEKERKFCLSQILKASVVPVFKLCRSTKYKHRTGKHKNRKRLRSFKVVDVGTNQKPVCDFLSVNNPNLHPIYLALFSSYRTAWVKLSHLKKGCLSLMHSFSIVSLQILP